MECVTEEREQPSVALSMSGVRECFSTLSSAPALGRCSRSARPGGAALSRPRLSGAAAGSERAGLTPCRGLAFRDWLSIPNSSTVCNSLGINSDGSIEAVALPVCCLQRGGTSASVRGNPWSGVRFPLITCTLSFSFYRLCHLPLKEMQPGRG